jgi:hypothetical protein
VSAHQDLEHLGVPGPDASHDVLVGGRGASTAG